MADFSSTEKLNAVWKHIFGILATSNGSGSSGKFWYEEKIPATHVITPSEIWSDGVPYAANYTQAKAATTISGSVVEDRTTGENVVLINDGSDWDFTVSGIIPKVGYQITDVHPSPTYIKSITNVVDLGGGTYKVTLNSNSGVSAGSAVLHSRIYLTEDIASNGLAWFVKSTLGDSFSATIENFVQPHKFGPGYNIRLFQANGSEIFTTAGAWIFNWQKGILLFASGYTPTDLSYSKPIYLEGFRYTGTLGGGSLAVPGTLNYTLRYDGSNWVQNGSLIATGTDVSVLNRLTVSGSIVVPSGLAPSGSAAIGTEGEVRYDSKFVYLYSSGAWRRSSLTLF
jgi:hypothetical protein